MSPIWPNVVYGMKTQYLSGAKYDDICTFSSITPITSNGTPPMRMVWPSAQRVAEQLAVDLAADERHAPVLRDVLVVEEPARVPAPAARCASSP